eukprot:TRINITY_DN8452_c0_g1_i3.p1 TRINITY_DN8452_c0_g1~~TRINITY_DN8452_c0_g1_i3.p1  ORF type:complete len:122 (+),score=20.25 TRINITY_DN8452_c0_g1_i3:92-457(+)
MCIFCCRREQSKSLRPSMEEGSIIKVRHTDSKLGNWILSLGELCKYLAKEAEGTGVEIFCGFPAVNLLYSQDRQRVTGVLTNSKGLSKTGEKKTNFEEGVEIQADVIILAEGSRGECFVLL